MRDLGNSEYSFACTSSQIVMAGLQGQYAGPICRFSLPGQFETAVWGRDRDHAGSGPPSRLRQPLGSDREVLGWESFRPFRATSTNDAGQHFRSASPFPTSATKERS